MLDVEDGAQQDRFAGGTQQIAEPRQPNSATGWCWTPPSAASSSHDAGVTVTSEWADRRRIRHRRDPTGASGADRIQPAAARRVRAARPALATGPAQQGLRRLCHAVLARPAVLRARRCPTRARCSSPSTSARTRRTRDSAGLRRRPRRSTRYRPSSAGNARWQCFAALFGDAALKPLDYVDHRWGAEEFAPGGPTAAVPPGSWTRFGPWLRAPVGRIYWAGTETADEWTGFLDGAVRSGQRAAAEVAALLGADAALLRVPHRFGECAQLRGSPRAGRSRIAQCPPGSSTRPTQVGRGCGDPAATGTIGSSRSVRCR